jgi:hypothetical protein
MTDQGLLFVAKTAKRSVVTFSHPNHVANCFFFNDGQIRVVVFNAIRQQELVVWTNASTSTELDLWFFKTKRQTDSESIGYRVLALVA